MQRLLPVIADFGTRSLGRLAVIHHAVERRERLPEKL